MSTSLSPVMASVGDDGALNIPISTTLSDVWIDRDVSWLQFNDRVLAEALDERTPLLERAKFLAIFTSNLDEFFMKRIAVLREGQAPEQVELRRRLYQAVLPMLDRQAMCYGQRIVPELAKHGVALRRWADLTSAQQDEASRYFDVNVSPALTPLVIDPAHTFPFLSNLSTSLTFLVHDPARTEPMYGRVKVPGVLKQWVPLSADLPAGERLFVLLQEIIRGNLHKLYAGMTLGPATAFRLTRDAEVELDDDPTTGLRELVREQVRQRRYEPVVRLEFGPGADPEIKEMLRLRFELAPEEIFDMPEEVDYTPMFELLALPLPALRDLAWAPLATSNCGEEPEALFERIRAGDILVHHPYESFDDIVERFISVAADDPQTVSIKMTAYRIGDDTPFVQSLIRAAESGKQVACVMEIQARFDEMRNLHWAAELEGAGAHVKFGVSGLKTHAKTALVVRKEPAGLRCYVHIGTGNYHVKTARLYSDVGLLTCDPALGQDAVQLFHYLTGHSIAPNCTSLLVAPSTMRPKLLELIRREAANQTAGLPARIVAKMNQLEDPEIIEALCEASNAGVPIDLIIRGFCCLRPGVAGKSENIRVRSIIGRFLEHSRIFHFADGKEDPADGAFFIGSADWMFRNLSKRVEVAAPVLAAGPREKLWEILDVCLRDRRQAWVLGSDGEYVQLHPAAGADGPEAMGTHSALMALAKARLAQ